MKYAFMSFSTPSLTLRETFETARRYGYDGIEPRLDAKHAHGVEVVATDAWRQQIRRDSEAAGVPLVCLATSLRYADPTTTQDMIRQSHERIDLAGDLGVPVIRVFGGQIPEGTSREQATELVASTLRSIADHAAERGVTVCMETHDDWCNPAHVAEVMRRANHPAVAVNWDIMHPVRTRLATMDQAFEALRPWIRHLHVHDGIGENVTLMPIGTGEIDHRRALALLKTLDYQGYVSGEWINWEPYDIHLPRELAALKQSEAT